MPGIFISYRRMDSQSAAGRLADHLNEDLREVSIFRDVETIEPGVDFVEAIEKALASCAAMLVVIGPRWVNATDPAGKRRLDDPNDYTRLEVGTALKRNVRVIPVLVEGAVMPAADELPEDLKPLARRNAIELTDSRWSQDVQRLVASLERALGMGRRGAVSLDFGRYRWVALLLVLALLGGGLYGLRDKIWGPGKPEGRELVNVPQLIGATQQEALARLRQAGLALAGVHRRVTDRAPPGQVVDQEPKEGRKLPRGAGVELVLAEAPSASGLPDLRVFLEGPSRAAPGEDIGDRLELVVRNLGGAPAPGTVEASQAGYMVDIVLTRNSAPAPRLAVYSPQFRDGALLRGGRVSRTRTLGPGEQATYRAGALIPPDTPPGEYCLGAVVDAGARVSESDEDNNTACHRLRIGESPGDLAISQLKLFPWPPTQGQEVTVHVEVTNLGDAPSGAYAVAWWPGENYPEPACRWDDLAPLPPEASKELSCRYPGYPSWYGRIRTKAEIDTGPDGNPDNNQVFHDIQVLRP